jgi:GT2 family glycosyltransferase
MSRSGHTEGQAPVVSIIVVTYNALEYTRQCLEGVLTRTRRVPFELIVVDNASEAETRDYLTSVDGIRLFLNDENKLWCAGVNQGMREVDPRSEYILLLNSDIVVQRDDWLEVLIDLMESDPKVGLVGPQHHRVQFGPIYGWVDGHCLLIRKQLIQELGYFDEERWPWGGAPMEFTIKAFSKGWIYKVVHPEDNLIYHFENKSWTPEIKKKLDAIPKAKQYYREVMEQYGVREETPLLQRKGVVPKTVRRSFERYRFYWAPPHPAPASTTEDRRPKRPLPRCRGVQFGGAQ